MQKKNSTLLISDLEPLKNQKMALLKFLGVCQTLLQIRREILGQDDATKDTEEDDTLMFDYSLLLHGLC